MRIKSLKIENFRNITLAALDNLGAVNVFIGENAQGKTNLLEAIHLVTTGASFRVTQEAVLLRSSENLSGVRAEIELGDGRDMKAAVAWQKGETRLTKRIQINGTDSNRLNLIKQFPVVIFSPEDIDLIRMSPSYRRRSLDLTISRTSPEYYQDLIDYMRVLKQRNQLLLNVRQGSSSEEELDVWDDQLATIGVRLIKARTERVSDLSHVFGKYYIEFVASSAGVREVAEFIYIPNVATTSAEDFKLTLRQMRRVDILRATTSKGPHRDDYGFKLNGEEVKNYASRGEYRSLLLALKLGEGELVEALINEAPVYLLDDPFSELDENRMAQMAQVLASKQVFVTSSDPGTMDLFENAKGFKVAAGEIVEYQEVLNV